MPPNNFDLKNAPVKIVYPIQGGSFPQIDPRPALSSSYFTFSFSVTKGGGSYSVEWGVDNQSLGKATYYDMFSSQFVWKLGPGKHEFWVKGGSGSDSVKFTV